MIEVEKLRKVYAGGVEAVAGIDFEVAPGEVFALLGPNGAGKSTMIGMLTTTVRPTGGTARLAGFDVRTQQLAARKVSSVVFQDSVVDRSLTGRRNLDLHGRLWGVEPGEAERRIEKLVDAVGLRNLVDRPVGTYSGGERRRLEIARALVSSPRVLFLDEPTVGLDPRIRAELLDRKVGTYSGGQRRRLEIARALVSRPRVLFLDEPTVGLDPRIRAELLDTIAALRAREEMTVLLTTHYLDEAERLCDRLGIMHRGEIVALDTPAALLARLGREIVELRVDGDAAGALAALRADGIAGDDAFTVGSRLTVPLHDRTSDEALAALRAVPAAAVATRRPTLDDVYLRLTGGRLAGEDA